jgi:hypothetical protein
MNNLRGVGYYPGSMYHGGQKSRYAQIIELGTQGVGTRIWPPEGSGNRSSYSIRGPHSSTSSGWARYFYEGRPGVQVANLFRITLIGATWTGGKARI